MIRSLTGVPLHELLGHLPASSSFRALQNPDILHSSVMRLFGPVPRTGDEGARAAAGVLFRIEPVTDGIIPFALIRSRFAPVVRTETMRTLAELKSPAPGSAVSFRIALNAVRRGRRTETIMPGGTTPIPEGALVDYVTHILSPALDDVAVLNHVRTVIGLNRHGRAPVQTDLFDGIATIANIEALEQILQHGAGRAKNFGCGMLTVSAI